MNQRERFEQIVIFCAFDPAGGRRPTVTRSVPDSYRSRLRLVSVLPGICTACLGAVGGTDGGYGSLHDQATASTGAAVGALLCRRRIRGDPGGGEGVVSTRRSRQDGSRSR